MEKIKTKAFWLLLIAICFHAVNAQTVNNIDANITVASGTIINFNGAVVNGATINNSGTVKLTGNFTNNGTGNVGTGEVQLNGTSGSQTIGGTVATTFGKLTVNNPNDVSLAKDAVVNNLLDFASGKINTGANKISIASGGDVTGEATGKYINGNLEKFIAGSTAAKDFEIGDGSSFTPINLTFAGTTNSGGSLTAHTTGGDHPQIVSSGLDASNSVNRYWTINNNGVSGFTTYNATFNFINPNDLDLGADPNTFDVRQYNGSWSVTTTGTRTSTATQATGLTSFTDYQVATLISGYVWLSTAVSHDWTTTANWLNGLVPPSASTSNVTIQTPNVNNNYPILPSDYVLGTVILNENATLDLSAFNLDVKGNWNGSGTSNTATVTGTGAVILSGNSLQTLSGKTRFDILRLNNSNGAELATGAVVDLYTSLDLMIGDFNAQLGTLTFKSTAANHIAILDNFTNYTSGTLLGNNVKIERYYNSASSFNGNHMMGSPVNTVDVGQFGATGTAGTALPTANCSEIQLQAGSPWSTVARLNQATVPSGTGQCALKSWNFVTGGTTLPNAEGVSVKLNGPGTLTLTGSINQDDEYTRLSLGNNTWSGSSAQGRPMGSGWHLVANPYAANLVLNAATVAANPGFSPTIQVWHVNVPFAGSYQTYNLSSSTVTLAPFQAFQVQRTLPLIGTGTYTISNNLSRTAQTFQANNNSNELTLLVTNAATQLADVSVVSFNDNATAQFDNDFDGKKFGGSLTRHTLYTRNSDPMEWYSINTLKSITETSTVPVGFEPGLSGTYTFAFNGINSFDPTSYITLEDKQLNSFHDVRSGDYNFTSDANDNWERFVLHFTPAAEIATVNQSCDVLGSIHIEQPGTAQWQYTVADGNGNIVGSGTLNQSTPVTVTAPAGTYTLTLTDANNYTVMKAVTISGTTPVAATASVSSTAVETGDDVTFTNTTTNAATTFWDFGDGTTSTSATETHVYTTSGTYTVMLTVTNADGCTGTTTQTITVTEKVVSGVNNIALNKSINIWSNENRVYIDFGKLTRVDADIQMYNVLGQQLVNERFGRSTIYSKPITNTEAAYVIVRVKNEDVITTKKVFIINKE